MIVLIGESASGKSTIEKELTKNGLNKIVSYTSRTARQGEINGVDYHYISKSEFERLLSEGFFAEHTIYNGWYYGIAKEDCKDNSCVVVEPHGLRLLKKIPELNIISFYIKVPEHERLVRIAKRGDNIMEIFRRIISDQGVFQGIEDEVSFTINGCDTIENNVNEILNYIGVLNA